MKIYADENIERSIIEGLRRRKIEVVSAIELGYEGKPDKYHIQKASEIIAVILTHDFDFLRIASNTCVNHNGLIFAHSRNVSIGQCIRGVELIVVLRSMKMIKAFLSRIAPALPLWNVSRLNLPLLLMSISGNTVFIAHTETQ